MHPLFHQALADVRAAELRRQTAVPRLADRRPRSHWRGTRTSARTRTGNQVREATGPHAAQPAITIRPAYADDRAELARLAQLDGAQQAPGTPVLVAEVEGVIHAALGGDGAVIADPFVRTAALVELLRAHARHTAPAKRGWFRMPSLTPVSGWRRAAA